MKYLTRINNWFSLFFLTIQAVFGSSIEQVELDIVTRGKLTQSVYMTQGMSDIAIAWANRAMDFNHRCSEFVMNDVPISRVFMVLPPDVDTLNLRLEEAGRMPAYMKDGKPVYHGDFSAKSQKYGIEIRGIYEHGKASGTWKCLDLEGNLNLTVEFAKEGQIRYRYFDKGTPVESASFTCTVLRNEPETGVEQGPVVNGYRDGLWTESTYEGRVLNRKLYKEGSPIQTIELYYDSPPYGIRERYFIKDKQFICYDTDGSFRKIILELNKGEFAELSLQKDGSISAFSTRNADGDYNLLTISGSAIIRQGVKVKNHVSARIFTEQGKPLFRRYTDELDPRMVHSIAFSYDGKEEVTRGILLDGEPYDGTFCLHEPSLGRYANVYYVYEKGKVISKKEFKDQESAYAYIQQLKASQ